jgi:hypothetical protein
VVAARGRRGTGTNQDAAVRHDLGSLLAHRPRYGQLSRAELTARMGLNRNAIVSLLGALEAWVAGRASDGAQRRPGRCRTSSKDVQADATRVHVLACEVRVEDITVARVGLGGVIVARAVAPTPASRTAEAAAAQTAVLSVRSAGRGRCPSVRQPRLLGDRRGHRGYRSCARPSEPGGDTILMGAAELAFQHMIEDPVAVPTACLAS